jgi:hypothetical protein
MISPQCAERLCPPHAPQILPPSCPLPTPRRRASAPGLPHIFTLSSDDKKAGHSGRRRSSLPNIPLCILPRRIPTTGGEQPGPVAAPPLRTPRNMSSDKHTFTSGQSHDGATISSRENGQGWTRRIVTSILRLCCCVPTQK